MSGKQLQAGPIEPELGPQQRWGWLLQKEQKQQAVGLGPAHKPGGQYPEAPSSLTPSTLWHPCCLQCEG